MVKLYFFKLRDKKNIKQRKKKQIIAQMSLINLLKL